MEKRFNLFFLFEETERLKLSCINSSDSFKMNKKFLSAIVA